jgi:hypothetical protein
MSDTNKEKLNLLSEFRFIDGEDTEFNEAFATINLNPAVTWAKFVLTDDKPNENRQRVPEEEFVNLIKTGVYMPIKMYPGEVAPGHGGAAPIGAIAHLKKVKNQILGLAALWDKERPEDVQLIKDAYANKKQLQLSWEILFGESSVGEDGVEDLKDTVLRAVTLVGMPAYAGRTPILAVASKLSDSYIEALPDDCFLFVDGGEIAGEGKASQKIRLFPYKNANGVLDNELLKEAIDKAQEVILNDGDVFSKADATVIIEKAKGLLNPESNLEEKKLEKLEELESKVSELDGIIKEKDIALSAKDNEIIELKKLGEELDTLRAFKADFDKQKEETDKLASIKTKFVEANLTKDEKYFEDNKEKLLAMPDEALSFLIQELVAFPKDTTASIHFKLPKVPKITTEDGKTIDAKELGAYLRNKDKES